MAVVSVFPFKFLRFRNGWEWREKQISSAYFPAEEGMRHRLPHPCLPPAMKCHLPLADTEAGPYERSMLFVSRCRRSPTVSTSRLFTPHMKPGTIVAVMPARSGGNILFSSLLCEKAKDMVFLRSETLTWACRFTEWGRRATILGTKVAAATPPTEAKRALPALQGLLGVFSKIEEQVSMLL